MLEVSLYIVMRQFTCYTSIAVEMKYATTLPLQKQNVIQSNQPTKTRFTIQPTTKQDVVQSNQPTKTRFTIQPTNKNQIYNSTNYKTRCCTI